MKVSIYFTNLFHYLFRHGASNACLGLRLPLSISGYNSVCCCLVQRSVWMSEGLRQRATYTHQSGF